MESVPVHVVKSLLTIGLTYSELSFELRQMCPHITRGLSERTIPRFVKDQNLCSECAQIIKEKRFVFSALQLQD